MKKAITLFLASIMLCTNCFAILVPHSGDVNEDGNISIVDVAKTRASIVKILQFTDEESKAADTNRDDLVDIKVNSTSIANSNTNIEGGKISSSSSGLSDGAIAGIIIAGAILLIAIVILVACCCCKKREVKPPFEESSVQQPFPKDTTNQSI